MILTRTSFDNFLNDLLTISWGWFLKFLIKISYEYSKYIFWPLVWNFQVLTIFSNFLMQIFQLKES